MKNNYFLSFQLVSLWRSILTGCLFFVVGLWLSSDAQAQVTGKVFRDFNANGTQDTPISSTASAVGEPGVPGILVTAYPVTGSPLSVSTAIDGSYSFPNSGITAAGSQLRLEFSGLTTGLYSAAYGTATTGSGTSTQFVTAGSATTANFGVNYPGEFCDSSPVLTVPCYISGDAAGSALAAEHVVVTFPYSASSSIAGTVVTNSVTPTPIADAGQIGSVWGMAYQRETNKLFSAAFLKRHVGLGTGGLGGIYVTNNANGSTANGSLYVDLEAAPFSLNLGQSVLGTRTLPNSSVTSSADPNSFSLIGKVGLGGLALSEDGSKLYTVDLFNQKVLILNIGNPAKASLSAGDLVQVSLPAITCPNGIARPFGISVYRAKVYVGVVCTAESPGSTSANLSASIYEMDEATQVFNPTSVFSAPLTYPKGYVHAAQLANGDKWETWTSSFSDFRTTLLSSAPNVYRTSRPQPILSDIDFTDNGDMVLSFMDRAGHQLGYRQVPPTGGGTDLYSGYVGGDILRARLQGSTWVLESAGKISSSTSGTLTGCGPTNGEGPGNGEFYCEDSYLTTHEETSQGGAVIIPGTNQTVSIHMDPLATWSGGTIWFNNTTGSSLKRYQLYRSTDASDGGETYGKANGLGLPVAMCDPAPVEIGNRVWLDTNKDGIQDPNETPIASVSVGLFNSGTLVATAVTNAKGEYYFSSATGTNSTAVRYNLALIRGGAYELRIVTTQPALSAYQTNSPANAGGNEGIDNDFTVSGSNMVTSLTVGMSGNNLHLFDAAVAPADPCSLTLAAAPGACNPATNQYSVSGTITLTNSNTAATATITDGTRSTTVTVPSGATAVAWSLTGLTANASSHTVTVTVATCGSASTTYTAPASCTAAPCSLTATAQASSQTIAQGQSVTLTAQVNPVGSYTYAWSGPNGATITPANASAVVASNLPLGTQAFTVVVSSSPSCSTTATVLVTVLPAPTQLSVMVGVPVCNSVANTYTATGTVSLTNAQAGTLSITDNGVPIASIPITAGQTSASFSVSGLSGSSPSVPAVVAMLGGVSANTTYTKPASCTACQAPIIAINPQSQTVCVDGTSPAPMSVSLVSGTATAYQWYGPSSSTATVLSTSIAGETNAMYQPSGDVAGTFYYAVVVQNGPASCTTVAYGTVVVNNHPELFQLPTSICAGQSIDILNSFSVANGPTSQIRIYRTIADQTANVNSLTNTVVSLTATTTFYVSMTNTAGCSWQDETHINVNPLPNAGSDQSLSCVAGVAPTTTNLVATSATGGVWSAAAGNPTATNFGSASALTTTVSGLNAPGSYTFVFTTTAGCPDAIVVTVPVCQTVCTQPVASISSGDNQTVCAGSAPQSLVSSITSGTAVMYQWYGPGSSSATPGTLIGGATSLTYSPPASSSVGTVYYTIIAQSASGSTCSGSAVAMLTVSPAPAFTATSTTVCSGAPLSYTAFVQMGPTTTYSVHATLADAEANANRLDPQQPFSISAATVYYVRGREINSNCTAIQSLTLLPLNCSVPTASLGDKVFSDNNKNGIQDAGDTPITGVTVTLISNGTVVATTTTLSSGTGIGCYSFTGLTPGVPYSVSFTTPANYTATTPLSGTDKTVDSNPVNGITAPVTLTAGENNPTLDAGFIPLKASLGDYVWLDTNKNGQQDGTESGVQSVTVILCDAVSGSAISTTVTDSQGKYLFSSLDPGSYIVKFTAPTGTTFTTPNSGTDATDSDVASLTGQKGSTGVYSLSAGEQNLTVDAGLIPLLGSIGDFVWKDANSNGIQDDGANSGMSNVRVNLLKETGTPGQFTVVATTTTSTSGLYGFTGLSAGNYKVQVDLGTVPFYCQPTTQTVVTPNDATNSKIDEFGLTPVIVIDPANPAQQNYPKADAGFSPLPLGSIGDYVWKDTNNDGIQNDGATGVANVGLKLLDSDGNYVITGPLSGAQENPPVSTSGTGLVYSTFDPITNQLDMMIGFNALNGTVTAAHIHTGVAGSNGPVIVDLVPLGFPTGVRAGNFVASTTLTAAQETLLLANKLYVNVHTSTNGGGEVRAQLVTCVFSSTAGAYLFANLPQGTYTVAVDTPTLPLTCTVSSKQNSTSATEATDTDFSPITGLSDPVGVVPSDPAQRDIRTVDLALVAPTTSSIGDLVWKDLVEDGRYDASTELGVAGISVRLLEVTSPVGATVVSTSLVSTTQTGSNGQYLFTGLPGGRYIIEIDKAALPTNCLISPDNQAPGVPPDLNSDIDPGTGRSPIIEIDPNDPTKQTLLTIDAALVNPPCPTPAKCIPITVQQVIR